MRKRSSTSLSTSFNAQIWLNAVLKSLTASSIVNPSKTSSIVATIALRLVATIKSRLNCFLMASEFLKLFGVCLNLEFFIFPDQTGTATSSPKITYHPEWNKRFALKIEIKKWKCLLAFRPESALMVKEPLLLQVVLAAVLSGKRQSQSTVQRSTLEW